MFSKQGLMNGKLQLVLVLALALVMMVPALTADAASSATASGDFCVDGLVIDWEEEVIEEGWFVTALPVGVAGDPLVAYPSEEDDEEGQFEFEDEDFRDADGNLIAEDWEFTIVFTEAYTDSEGNAVAPLIGDWEGVTPTTLTVPFEYGADKCVRIRFKLREIVSVLAIKMDSNHKLLEDWNIIASPGPKNYFAEEYEGETDANGEVVFELTPGHWIFTEEAPDDADYKFSPVIPVTGKMELNIESAEDQDEDQVDDLYSYVVRFKNELINGCIEVTKFDDASAITETEGFFTEDFPLAGWEISVLRKDGSEAAFGYTDASGSVKFEYLPYGPYTVVEETRPGWEAVSPNAMDVTVSDNTCQEVDFTNVQAGTGFCIEGKKLDANGKYGLAEWEIKADPTSKGGYEPDNVFTDGLGNFKFEFPADDYRIPGSSYKVCEDDDVDGWLPHTSTCFTVTLPKHPGACVQVPDFVNQQVGHTESGKEAASHGWSSGGSMSMGGGMAMGGMDMQCSKYHKAQKGEGLYEIGAMYMVPANAMLMANPTDCSPLQQVRDCRRASLYPVAFSTSIYIHMEDGWGRKAPPIFYWRSCCVLRAACCVLRAACCVLRQRLSIVAWRCQAEKRLIATNRHLRRPHAASSKQQAASSRLLTIES